jgi:hypothetical protein
VRALIAVEPPAQLSQSFFEDDKALKTALNELGSELERATIAGDDPARQEGLRRLVRQQRDRARLYRLHRNPDDCLSLDGIAPDFALEKTAQQI